MSLVAVAFCPHPPLLVPEVAGAAASELADARRACDEAVRRLLDQPADGLLLVGTGPRTGWQPAGARGSLAPYGVQVEVALPTGSPPDGATLPLSLTIGAWLLARQARYDGRSVVAMTVAEDTPPDECRKLGRECADWRGRVAMLVMGDGAACHGEKSPGYADPRAEPFDASVARAFADGDPGALRDLDPDLGAGLLACGRAPWQVAAGAAEGGRWRGDLLYHAAPYGVGYLIASWTAGDAE